MTKLFILMGKIVEKNAKDAGKQAVQLKGLLTETNQFKDEDLLLPFTTTLGDEFLGITNSLKTLIECVFFMEDSRFKERHELILRYVVHYGEIQSPVLKKKPSEIIGSGLTKTRSLLEEKHRGHPRFLFEFPNKKLSINLTRLFKVIEKISNRWSRRDYLLIFDMLSVRNNEYVAGKHGKNRSQIWKRRKTLLVEEYRLIKDVVFDLIEAAEIRRK